jgi:hypothetical protein
MTVQAMIDDIRKTWKTKQFARIVYYLELCIERAVALAKAKAKNFDNLDACIDDACIQFRVLRNYVCDENNNLYVTVESTPIELFRELQPEAYKELESYFNERNQLTT